MKFTTSTAEAVDTLLEHGFAVISGVFNVETLQLLRKECHLLSCMLSPENVNGVKSWSQDMVPDACFDGIIKQGCIVQPLSPNDVSDSEFLSLAEYKRFRNFNCLHGNIFEYNIHVTSTNDILDPG